MYLCLYNFIFLLIILDVLYREDAIEGDIIIGTFKYDRSIHNTEVQSILMDVQDPFKTKKYESKESSGSFSINVRQEGIHDICFWNTGRNVRSVTLEIRNTLKKNKNENMIKTKHIQPLQQQMEDIVNSAQHLRNDLQHLKEREWQMRDLNEKTNERVVWFTFFSIAIFVIAGLAKIIYLKSFFTKKKLI